MKWLMMLKGFTEHAKSSPIKCLLVTFMIFLILVNLPDKNKDDLTRVLSTLLFIIHLQIFGAKEL